PNAAFAAATNLPAGSVRANAITSVLSQLAQQDPAAAMTLVNTTATGSQRDNLLKAIAKALYYDPTNALTFAAAMPVGTEQNKIVDLAMLNLSRIDPQQALVAAKNFSSDSARRFALSQVGAEWVKSDPKAAIDWASALSEGEG